MRDKIRLLPEYQGALIINADKDNVDHDSLNFVKAWDEVPRFSDTLQWWYGPWGQKDHPFYRPIPSLIFWTQYQIFGAHGKLAFHVLLLAWHFVAVFLIWRFLCVLFNLRDATLITGLWSTNIAGYLWLMIPGDALSMWKDNVESWHAIAQVLCLWAFWRYLHTREQRWQIGALALFWVALCIKEMAYMAPFMMLLLAWHARKWQQGLRAVAPFFVLAGAMFFFRLWALGGMGYRMGSNNHWKYRLFSDNLSGVFSPILKGEWLILSTIVIVVAIWHLAKRRWISGGLLLGSAMLMQVATGYWSELGFVNTVSRLLVPQELTLLPLLSLMLFLWWRFFKTKNRPQIFGALWALILYAPLTSGPNTSHIFYFVSVGWCIWLYYGLVDMGRLILASSASRGLTLASLKR